MQSQDFVIQRVVVISYITVHGILTIFIEALNAAICYFCLFTTDILLLYSKAY